MAFFVLMCRKAINQSINSPSSTAAYGHDFRILKEESKDTSKIVLEMASALFLFIYQDHATFELLATTLAMLHGGRWE